MLERHAHFWLCCMPGKLEGFEEKLSGAPIRTKRATKPSNKFGSYDYIFIDSPMEDSSIDFVLQALLDVLEPHAEVILGLDPILSGIKVSVASKDSRYAEEVSSVTLGRLAELQLRVTLAFEHVADGERASSESP